MRASYSCANMPFDSYMCVSVHAAVKCMDHMRVCVYIRTYTYAYIHTYIHMYICTWRVYADGVT